MPRVQTFTRHPQQGHANRMTQNSTANDATTRNEDRLRAPLDDSPPEYNMAWPAAGMPALVLPADGEPAIWMSPTPAGREPHSS